MASEFEIRKQITLPASAARVWHAVATQEGQAGWSPDPYSSQEGMSVESVEEERLAVSTPKDDNGAFHSFEYLLEPEGDKTTELTFIHSGSLGEQAPIDADDFAEMTGYGWDMYLVTLSHYLTYFDGQSTNFVTAQGPESSANPESWAKVMDALGVEGPFEEGQSLRLKPKGLPELEGVVDFTYPPEINFLSVRTADGLYRFHDNSAMGMPQAIGHYIYADIDREATEKQWADWLDRVLSS